METPDLLNALDETAGKQPDVMPTAPILQKEYEDVNKGVPLNGQAAPTVQPSPSGVKLNKDGTPRKQYTKKGQTGEKPAQKGYVGGTIQNQGKPDNSDELAKRRDLAIKAITLVEQSGTMIAQDAAKMAEIEKQALIAYTDDYLKSKNINDLPPGLVLTIGLSMYYGRVLNIPDQRDATPRSVKIIFWLKQKFSRKNKNARFNTGNDGKRENDISENSGTKV